MNKLIAFVLVFAPVFGYAQNQWGTYQIKDELTGKSTSVTAFKSKLGFTNYPESKLEIRGACELDGAFPYKAGVRYTLTTINAPLLPKIPRGLGYVTFRTVLQSADLVDTTWFGTEYKNQLLSFEDFEFGEKYWLNNFNQIQKRLPKKLEVMFADGNKFIIDFDSKDFNQYVSACFDSYKKTERVIKKKKEEAQLDKERIVEEEQEKIRMQEERENQNVEYEENRLILNKEIKAKLKDSKWNISLTIEVMTHYDSRVFENIKKHEKNIVAELNLILERFSEKQFKDSKFSQNIEGLFKEEMNSLLEQYEDFGGIEKVKIIKTKEFYQ